MDDPFIDLDYAVRTKAPAARRSRRVASGEVRVELAHDGDVPTVQSATLVAHVRRPLE